MALIICTDCGKEFSDKAGACPNCGCPISEMNNQGQIEHVNDTPDNKGFFAKMIELQKDSNAVMSGKRCPKCSGSNISIQFVESEEKHRGRNEVRKKSIATRAGNKAGRAAMIGMTGGLWALTPKKSDYSEVRRGKSKIKNQKMAICQDCGRSWKTI